MGLDCNSHLWVPKQVAWEYRHGQTKVDILFCVRDSILQHVFQAKTSKEAWNIV